MIFETNMYRNRTQQLYYLKVQQSKVYEKKLFYIGNSSKFIIQLHE